MNYNVTHVTVKDTVPPPRPVITVGRLYPINFEEPETVFRTVERDEEIDDDETEAKVVRPRRGRRPKSNEAAETK